MLEEKKELVKEAEKVSLGFGKRTSWAGSHGTSVWWGVEWSRRRTEENKYKEDQRKKEGRRKEKIQQ